MSSYVASAGMLALTASSLFSGTALANPTACPANSALSCHSSSTTPTCCYSYPGGALLQTQFWDTNPSTGPVDSWTIHGLWPDNCDGTYQTNCDPKRSYTNITAILNSQGRSSLVSYMNQYWVDINGNNEGFWEHEWNTHGTCLNTIDPNCYTNYQPQQEVGDFFQKVTDLFKGLDTYKALAAAGITPDSSKTYTASQIQSALNSISNATTVHLGCQSGVLNEVWYFYNVQGNVIDGQYENTNSLSSSTCPSTGIKYVPK